MILPVSGLGGDYGREDEIHNCFSTWNLTRVVFLVKQIYRNTFVRMKFEAFGAHMTYVRLILRLKSCL